MANRRLLLVTAGVAVFCTVLLWEFQGRKSVDPVSAEVGLRDAGPATTGLDVQDVSATTQDSELSEDTSPPRAISASLESPPRQRVSAGLGSPTVVGATDVISDLAVREFADRTPRPYLNWCSADLESPCSYDRTILTEAIDPKWSDVTEKRLKAIWTENVPDLPDDFLFVMCKTTICQVNYRFPPEALSDNFDGPYGAFLTGFKQSTLHLELRREQTTFSGSIMSLKFTRIRK
jgi:hypothetical protein